MASPAELGKKNVPDTLPADFGEWDNDSSTSIPADSSRVESRGTVPNGIASREAAGREFQPQESTPVSTSSRGASAREFADRVIQGDRNTAPVPRGPVAMPTPRSYAAPAAKTPRAVATPEAESYPNDEAFFRRIRSLNTVVDTLPTEGQPKSEPASAAVATVEEKPVEEVLPSATEEESTLAFRTDLAEPEDAEARGAKRKLWIIAAVGGGSLILVMFQLIHSGAFSTVRHVVVPPTTTVSSTVQPDSSPVDETLALGPTANKPSASTVAKQTGESQAAADETQATQSPVESKMMHDQLLAPSRIPQSVKTGVPNDAPPAAAIGGASMAALGGNGAIGDVFNGTSNPKATAVTLKRVTVSAGVAAGMLVHKTQPAYPAIAKAARVTGTVVIEATISKTGAVENARVSSGPTMLRQAALDAVKTWRFRPYKLNDQPTEVETTVDVIFDLGN